MQLALMTGATAPALMGFGSIAEAPQPEPVAVTMPAPDIAPLSVEMAEPEIEQEEATQKQVVEASYYGDGFDGRLTANGETFDKSAMTAAHKTLPFGTMVKVTSVDSGESVTVRINDRGPYHGDRAIDLAEGAAQQLGMLGSGTAKVQLDVIG